VKKPQKKLLHKALDGEASRSETRRLERQLEVDGKMRQEYEQLQRVMKDSSKIKVIGVPKDFTSKVLRETERRRAPGK
jgi:anti-sigma factor RsiW